MVKKRIIFTLLYDGEGYFVLSRNFRLQKIGDLHWLKKQYNFAKVSFFIDELIILDVSRKTRSLESIANVLQVISKECFIPISVGGGIYSVDQARELFRSGADKVVINSCLLDETTTMVSDLAEEFGSQSILGCLDLKRHTAEDRYDIFIGNGSEKTEISITDAFSYLAEVGIGELYLNSIDRDGTGTGLDFEMLNLLPKEWPIPIILSGGIGNRDHFVKGLRHDLVDAVATANLLNFVGDGLRDARTHSIACGINLAKWPSLSSVAL